MAPFLAEVRDGLAHALLAPERAPAPASSFAEGSVVAAGAGALTLLADPKTAHAELYRVAASHGLDPFFPVAVEEEVAARIAAPGIDDRRLVDRCHDPFVTIDGADSRDLDQAIWVERFEDGYVVHYALADASHFVRPGTALFDEALRRGASFYLPGLMVPMLPRALSEDLVSLNPHVDRRAMLLSMWLDPRGVCMRSKVSRSRIRSRAKLAFEDVQALYDGTVSSVGYGDAVDESLRGLREVGELRMQLATERDVIRYRRSEVVAKLHGEGYRFVVTSEVRRDVERYNEQVSLLCNVEGAKLLHKRAEALGGDEVEPIYRVHPAPSRSRLEAFEEMLAQLARSHDLDPARWTWRRGGAKTLAAFLDGLPKEGREGRIARAIHRQAVMVNVRSVFDTAPARHHGVGAEVYARFSAPMREIVGVFLHHEMWEALAGKGDPDPALCARIVSRSNDARLLQKNVTDEANRLVLDQLLGDARRKRRTLPGTVVGMTPSKVHVLLDDPEVDVKVYTRHLRDACPGPLRLSPERTELWHGDALLCRLGEAVEVTVRGRDAASDRWNLVL